MRLSHQVRDQVERLPLVVFRSGTPDGRIQLVRRQTPFVCLGQKGRLKFGIPLPLRRLARCVMALLSEPPQDVDVQCGHARIHSRPYDEESRGLRPDPMDRFKFGGGTCPQIKPCESHLMESFENFAVVSNPRFSQPV